MDLTTIITERRSIRRFNSRSVSQELVTELLAKAVRLYGQSESPRVRFVYAGTPEARERLVDGMTSSMRENKLMRWVPGKMIELFKSRFTAIPGHLIVVAEADPDRRGEEDSVAAACGIMQIFQLLGWEQGLGMLWDTERIIQNEVFFKQIGIRDPEVFVGILHIGYFDKAPRGRSRTPAEKKWTVYEGREARTV